MTIEEKIKELSKLIGATDELSIAAPDSLEELPKAPKTKNNHDEVKASARSIRKSVERYSRELERYA